MRVIFGVLGVFFFLFRFRGMIGIFMLFFSFLSFFFFLRILFNNFRVDILWLFLFMGLLFIRFGGLLIIFFRLFFFIFGGFAMGIFIFFGGFGIVNIFFSFGGLFRFRGGNLFFFSLVRYVLDGLIYFLGFFLRGFFLSCRLLGGGLLA